MQEKQMEQVNNMIQAGPPTTGSYFSKTEERQTEHKDGGFRAKNPKRTCATGYQPKLNKFRHLQVTYGDEPFTHDMSGTYYTDLYRFFRQR